MNKRLHSLIYRLELEMDDYHECTEEEHLIGAYKSKWGQNDIPTFEEIKEDWEYDSRVTRLCDEIIKLLAA